MKNYSSELDHTMWIFAVVLVAWAIIQAFLYFGLAYRFNKKHRLLTREEVKTCVKSGVFSVIGPSFSSIVFSLSLLSIFGPATTFMRLGVLGSAMMEYSGANRAAILQGIAIGVDNLSNADFMYLLFGMIFMSLPFLVSTQIVLPPLDKITSSQGGRSKNRGSATGTIRSITFGIMGYTVMMYFKGIAQIGAFFAAFAVASILNYLAKTKKLTWLYPFMLLIVLLSAMIIGQLIVSL